MYRADRAERPERGHVLGLHHSENNVRSFATISHIFPRTDGTPRSFFTGVSESDDEDLI